MLTSSHLMKIFKRIDKSDLASISKPELKLVEIEIRTNKLLFQFIDELINESIEQNKNRLQIVMKSGVHYTVIDIDIKLKSCIIVDAAQDFRRTRLHKIAEFSKHITDNKKLIDIRAQGFEHAGKVINGGAIQKSDHGCWVFALNQCFEIAKLATIHNDLLALSKYNQNDKLNTVDWISLPPALVKLAQSQTFLKYYISKNPEHSVEINRLTNNNSKFYGYLSAIEELKGKLTLIFDRKTDAEIENIISGNTSSMKFSSSQQ